MKNKLTFSSKTNKIESEKKLKEAEEFIYKLNEEKKERQRKEQKRLKILEEKIRKEDEELSKNQKEEEEAIKKRNQESIESYIAAREKHKNECQRNLTIKSEVRFKPENEYLYRRLEEKYHKDVLIPILEEKKKVLEKKRNLYKQIDKQEIKEHVKSYNLIIAKKKKEKDNELKAKLDEEKNIKEKLTKLRTQTHEYNDMIDLNRKKEQEERIKELRNRRIKMEDYANSLKVVHPVREPRDIRKNY